MSQIIRTEPLRDIVRGVEATIRERFIARMGGGGLLEGITPFGIYFHKKFAVGAFDLPGVFVLREPITPVSRAAHTVFYSLRYSITPIVQDTDGFEGERDSLEYATNIADMFISEGDRSLGGQIHDVLLNIISPSFPEGPNNDIHWTTTQLDFQFYKRAA